MVLRSIRYQPPLRRCLRPAISQNPLRRAFHPSPHYLTDGLSNHYDTLELQSNASPADIKKQFYKLSKTHHPDRNPNDPKASERFVKISEAYAVLGSTDKRTRYDRDFIRTAPASQHYPSGSYSSSSSTPAGSRPASGLSKRRTQFKGPPPSFYRNGGWGQYSQKRAESASKASHEHERASSAYDAPGTGPSGFTQGFDNDVPYFNRESHLRSHDAIERKKAERQREATLDRMRETGPSMLFSFVLMTGVLGLIFGVSGAFFHAGSNGGRRTHATP